MKLFLELLTTTTLLGACKNNKMSSYTEKEEDEIIATNVYADQIITEIDDININIKIEKLRKLKPMTLHEAAVLLPGKINDYELVNALELYAYTLDDIDTYEIGLLLASYNRIDDFEFDSVITDSARNNADLIKLNILHISESI